jgi:hypothetical protein
MGTSGSFPGVTQPEREADHSPPSSAEVKECVDLYLHSSSTPSWSGAQLKHRDNISSPDLQSDHGPHEYEEGSHDHITWKYEITFKREFQGYK